MSTRTPLTPILALVLIAAATVTAGCASRTNTRAPGDIAPTRTVDGTAVEFESALAEDGETLVLFMTQWCAVCEAEQPDVEAWARAHERTKTVVVIMQADAKAGQALVTKRKMDTSVLKVLVDPDGSVAKQFGVTATPTLIEFAGKTPKQRFYRIAQVQLDDGAPKDEPDGATPAPIGDDDAPATDETGSDETEVGPE